MTSFDVELRALIEKWTKSGGNTYDIVEALRHEYERLRGDQ
jgi:hypothetical protein